MKSFYNNRPNGYLETIEKGLYAVRGFRSGLSYGARSREENLRRLKTELETADAIVIGAGAGLSTAAVGMTVVFIGLIILIGMIYVMTMFTRRTGKKKAEIAPPVPAAQGTAETQRTAQ